MSAEERQKRIDNYLKQVEFASLEELAKQVNASVSTVRRDLTLMETTGVLKRTHGGARLTEPPSSDEFIFSARETHQLTEKEAIGKACAELIQPNQSVIIDAGTTAYHAARYLEEKTPHIITNSLPVANFFAGANRLEVVVSGGVIYPRLGVLVGPLAVEAFTKMHADVAIMSGGGIVLEGVSNSHGLLIDIQRAMINAAQKVISVSTTPSSAAAPSCRYATWIASTSSSPTATRRRNWWNNFEGEGLKSSLHYWRSLRKWRSKPRKRHLNIGRADLLICSVNPFPPKYSAPVPGCAPRRPPFHDRQSSPRPRYDRRTSRRSGYLRQGADFDHPRKPGARQINRISTVRIFQLRTSLLPRLESALVLLRNWREIWLRVCPTERACCSEAKELFQSVQRLLMKLLLLDRENQQALLQRGLVPPCHLATAAVQQPNFVANVYKRHTPS